MRASGRSAGRGAYGLAGVLAIALVWAVGNMFVAHPSVPATGNGPALTPVDPAKAQKDWAHYGNTEGGSRFAALDQINRTNINQLKVAWTYHTGDVAISDGNGAEDQLTPLQVGDKVFPTQQPDRAGCRHRQGVVEEPDQRPVQGLAALPRHGVLRCEPAGAAANSTEQRAGDCRHCAGWRQLPQLSSAPLMAGTTVVVGGRVADNVQTDMPGGVIRGFDVITGAMRWAFDPGNPQDKQAPTDGKTYVRSTPNSWAPMSYDPAMNTVFLPMGSSSTDIYGVERTALNHKYGASILALDASTGAEKWVYQTVHNDLWDFDLPMQPSLIDFTRDDGKQVPAVVIGTKAGQIYVLDRATGQPLTRVEEVPVKAANIPNEPYSLTQPKSVGMPQIGAQTLTESDMWGATPFDQLLCRIDFKKMRYDGLYTAPGTDLSLSFPGSLGGMNWAVCRPTR